MRKFILYVLVARLKIIFIRVGVHSNSNIFTVTLKLPVSNVPCTCEVVSEQFTVDW